MIRFTKRKNHYLQEPIIREKKSLEAKNNPTFTPQGIEKSIADGRVMRIYPFPGANT